MTTAHSLLVQSSSLVVDLTANLYNHHLLWLILQLTMKGHGYYVYSPYPAGPLVLQLRAVHVHCVTTAHRSLVPASSLVVDLAVHYDRTRILHILNLSCRSTCAPAESSARTLCDHCSPLTCTGIVSCG